MGSPVFLGEIPGDELVVVARRVKDVVTRSLGKQPHPPAISTWPQ